MSKTANEIVETNDVNDVIETPEVAPVEMVEPAVDPVEAVETVEPVVEPQEPVEKVKKKKHAFSRLLAFILAIAPIALLCLLPSLVLVRSTKNYEFIPDKSMLDAFLALINEFLGKDGIAKFYESVAYAPASFENFKLGLPLIAGNEMLGKIYSLYFYVIPVAFLLNFVLMLVALFSGKKAPAMVRTIAFIDFFVFGSYLIGVLAIAKLCSVEVDLLSMPVLVLGGIAVLGLFFYIVYALKRVKGVRAPNFFLFVLTLLWIACLGYVYLLVNVKSDENIRFAIKALESTGGKSIIPALTYEQFFQYLVWGTFVVAVLNFFVSLIRLSTKKGLLFDVIRHIFHLILTGIWVFIAFATDIIKDLDFMAFKLFMIVAAVIALLQIILAATTRARLKKATKIAVQPVAEEQEVQEEQKEEELTENVDAFVYDYNSDLGGVPMDNPVSMEVETVPVEEKEETDILPAKADGKAVEPHSYDVYNCKNFDPFIATLSDEERTLFTEIFILKYRGEMKYLPDYVVGGDNTDFFRKVFIYLGQYREKIPSGILAKIYTFSSGK